MEIKDVEKLAELARIELSDIEKKELLSDMEGILGYVKQIESVEVSARNASSIADAGGEDINPQYDLYNVWREDKIEPQEFSREKIVEQFPDSKDGFVKVKKIM